MFEWPSQHPHFGTPDQALEAISVLRQHAVKDEDFRYGLSRHLRRDLRQGPVWDGSTFAARRMNWQDARQTANSLRLR